MNILETVMGAGNGAAVNQVAAQFGLRPEQASAAIGALMPALAGGLQQNMSSPDGLAGLVGAITGGGHAAYLDDPSTLADPATTADGNGILGHVFGSKEVSREVAARASQTTGIDPSILKKMLPVVAAMAMAGLARQSRKGGIATGDNRAAGAGIGAMLGPLLDRNKDGSMVDDVTGMIGGFLRRK